MVVRSRTTTRDAVISSIRSMTDVGANILGGVLNGVNPSSEGSSHVGSSYYHYYRSEGYGPDILQDNRPAA